jgi:hypothetical protein
LGVSVLGELDCAAEGHDEGDVLGAAVHAVFLAASVDGGFEVESFSDVESADAFGGVHLVPGHGE